MNYRHIYHAGNFADVIKHVLLIAILQALQKKENPLCFLDTHAGIGLYALDSIQAQKKQEYENGIAKLFYENRETMPSVIQDYVSIVKNYNNKNLRYYPGSPLVAANAMRAQDEMILCELHPDDYQTLKNTISGQSIIATHHLDAYSAIKAFTPPKLKRGLVLIDPPFEVTDEFDRIHHALLNALKHWRLGLFMVWYPIKNHIAVQKFYCDIKAIKVPHLIIQFGLNTGIEDGKLSQCGLLLINPPWKIKELLETSLLPYLSDKLDSRWKIL